MDNIDARLLRWASSSCTALVKAESAGWLAGSCEFSLIQLISSWVLLKSALHGQDGRTALMHASNNGHRSIVDLLSKYIEQEEYSKEQPSFNYTKPLG